VLEDDALGLQGLDDSLDVVHDPGGSGGLVRSGIAGLIDQDTGVSAPVRARSLLLLSIRLEAQRVLVEFAGCVQVLDGNCGDRVSVSQLVSLLMSAVGAESMLAASS
jgi:hypothetical protein